MNMLGDITPLILTYNESANIRRTLERLSWARHIVVIDSFSDDETLEILAEHPQVRVFQRKFDSFADQCNFGLLETGISTTWVLNLDADYVLTTELIEELKTLDCEAEVSGYRAKFVYCINGKRLRSGVYGPVTVLFRRAQASFRDDGHAHRVIVDGPVEKLGGFILHDDRKPLMCWLKSQLTYSQREANMIASANAHELIMTARIRRLRIVAPFAMLFYCLVWRAGLLDGFAGFYYAFQRAMAELQVSLFLLEHDFHRRAEDTRLVSELSKKPLN
jgi:glycosyltransferase involved in cell wall biosynthesis